MQNVVGEITVLLKGVPDRVNDDVRVRCRLDRVAHDLVGPGVCDYAVVELVFCPPMLRQIREPEPVWCIRGKQSCDQIIEHGAAFLLVPCLARCELETVPS